MIEGSRTVEQTMDAGMQRRSGRGVRRRDLEVVVRRALELASEGADPEERLSEDELLRIGAELGLEAEHVLRALAEAPGGEERGTLLFRLYGGARAVSARVVPLEATAALQELEDYLTTREYLQVQRRSPAGVRLVPAADALSGVFRAFSRPASRFTLARAVEVELTSRSADPGSVVCVAVDVSDRRRAAAQGAAATGVILGGALGGGAFMAVGGVAAAFGGGGVEVLLAALGAGGVGFAATLSAAIAVSVARFQERVARTRNEVEALLDRLERRERLDPPPAPWLKGFRLRALGTGS